MRAGTGLISEWTKNNAKKPPQAPTNNLHPTINETEYQTAIPFQPHSPPIPAPHLHPNLSTTAAEAVGSPRCIAVWEGHPSTEVTARRDGPDVPERFFSLCGMGACLVMGRKKNKKPYPDFFFFNSNNYPFRPFYGYGMPFC